MIGKRPAAAPPDNDILAALGRYLALRQDDIPAGRYPRFARTVWAGISFPYQAKLFIFPMIEKNRPPLRRITISSLRSDCMAGEYRFPVKQAGYGRTISLYRRRPSHRIGGVNDSPKGNVLLYTTGDGLPGIEVTLVNDTVWLTADQMATLFQRNKSTISRHRKNRMGIRIISV